MSVQTFTFISLMVDKAWTLPSLRVQTHQNNLKESPHIASVLQKKLHLKTPQEYSPRPNALPGCCSLYLSFKKGNGKTWTDDNIASTQENIW